MKPAAFVVPVCFLLRLAETWSSPIHKVVNSIRRKSDAEIVVMDRISQVNELWIKKMANYSSHEADIMLTKRDRRVYEASRRKVKRNAVRQRRKLWPGRVVPYEISPEIESYTPTILDAIHQFELNTCLKFKKRTTERNWVKFKRDKGCWSYIGRIYWRKGGQTLSLGYRCNNRGIIMHEMMHAIGFWHEQSRPDRDKYVEVLWDNISKGMRSQFNKYRRNKVDAMAFDYDFGSLMHYGKRTFSKNRKPTIRSLRNPNIRLGRSDGFSSMDIKKINKLYHCGMQASGLDERGWSPWTSFTPCDRWCRKFRQRICVASSRSKCPGVDSHGVQTARVKCSRKECHAAVHGKWSEWSGWSGCDKKCGYGKQKRTRTCTDPRPKNGGRGCTGASVKYRTCNMNPCEKDSDDCNFEEDFCHWTNDWTNSLKFKWRRYRGSTPSRNTGPDGDHSSGSGYYVYIETSSPARRGYRARLLSRVFPPSGPHCLKWWYNMNGLSIGYLNVYLLSDHGNKKLIWMKAGHQGKDWKKAQVNIHSLSKYQVVFEGIRGHGYTGDIAIDDVMFEEGRCEFTDLEAHYNNLVKA